MLRQQRQTCCIPRTSSAQTACRWSALALAAAMALGRWRPRVANLGLPQYADSFAFNLRGSQLPQLQMAHLA